MDPNARPTPIEDDEELLAEIEAEENDPAVQLRQWKQKWAILTNFVVSNRAPVFAGIDSTIKTKRRNKSRLAKVARKANR